MLHKNLSLERIRGFKMRLASTQKIFNDPGIIDLSGRAISDEYFSALLESIVAHNTICELRVTKAMLTEWQQKQLVNLAGINTLKGLKISTTEGVNLGSIYTNWDTYNFEKQAAYLDGMHQTTKVALDSFRKEYGQLPFFVLDFGAGTGQDCINLALEGCPKIWAVDGDGSSLNILEKSYRQIKETTSKPLVDIVCITEPFIQIAVPQPVDLLVSSYTWPYRRPEDFPACWQKCVQLVKPGGYISGHFFGPKADQQPDPGLTYHNADQLKTLLAQHFEIIWLDVQPAGSDFKIYGGAEPSWGDLYLVVAKKSKNLSS